MVAFFIILATMSVPLAAIVSRTFLKAKQMELNNNEVRALIAENADLERRVQVLESIAIDDGFSVAVPPARVQVPANLHHRS